LPKLLYWLTARLKKNDHDEIFKKLRSFPNFLNKIEGILRSTREKFILGFTVIVPLVTAIFHTIDGPTVLVVMVVK
jgi:hypothetical protein